MTPTRRFKPESDATGRRAARGTRALRRGLLPLALGALLLSAAGCTVISDAFDPGFAETLGLPTSGATGSVIVVFENETSSAAQFHVFAVQDANATDGVDYSLPVSAGDTDNVVFDCPIQRVALGSPSADLVSDNIGATVFATDGDVAVAYAGGAFEVNDTFSCGDVIAVRLQAITTTGTDGTVTSTFGFEVEIIPGS